MFYLPDDEAWRAAVARMEGLEGRGVRGVSSFNPYWEVKGRTFEDADGWRVVLQCAGWENGKG